MIIAIAVEKMQLGTDCSDVKWGQVGRSAWLPGHAQRQIPEIQHERASFYMPAHL